MDKLYRKLKNHLRKSLIAENTDSDAHVGSFAKQGHFGSGVASYFVFLRLLCILNICLGVVVVSFLVVPQLLIGSGLYAPASVKATQSSYSFIFDGKGYIFEYSVLFYGFYYGTNSSIVPRSYSSGYNISLAYLLTISATFLVSLLFLLFTLAGTYKVVGTSSSVTFLVFQRVLCSWDYTITSKDTALSTKRLIVVSIKAQAVVTAVNFIFPWIFIIAEIFEKYEPRTALKIKLTRIFLLYLSSLYIVIISLLTVNRECVNMNNASCCWETTVGQAMYRLTLTHLAVELLTIVTSDGVRWVLVKANLCKLLTRWLGLAEFGLANNVLQLIYGQGLVWLGILFCPLLSLINTFKLIILFYFRAFAVYFFNRPPNTLFPVASTKNFYMGLLALTLFLCTLPMCYTIAALRPSTGCGPFRSLTSMLQIVSNAIATLPSGPQSVFKFVQTSAVLVPVIVVLCIGICYTCALLRTVSKRKNDLELQLHNEQRDTRKKFTSLAQELPQCHIKVNRHRHLTMLLKRTVQPTTENEPEVLQEMQHEMDQSDTQLVDQLQREMDQSESQLVDQLQPLGLTAQQSQGFAEGGYYQLNRAFPQDQQDILEEYEMNAQPHSPPQDIQYMNETQDPTTQILLSLLNMEEPQDPTQVQLYLQNMEEPQDPTQSQLYLQNMEAPQDPTQVQLYLQNMEEPQDPIQSQSNLEHVDQAQHATQDCGPEMYQQSTRADNPHNSTIDSQMENLQSDSYYQTLLTPPPAPPILAMDESSVPEQIDQATPPSAIPLPHVPDDITSEPQPSGDSFLSKSAELYSYIQPPSTLPELKMVHMNQPDPNP
eukprot:Em0016g1119a